MKLIRVPSMYTMTPMYPMYKERHMENFKKIMRHIKLISMNKRLFLMQLAHAVDQVQSMYTMTPVYHRSKDRHMKKFKRVMRHIKLISMNRRLFWMHLEVY
jgi:hypothetical protein